MSEEISQQPTEARDHDQPQAMPAAAQQPGQSAGQLLRRYREQAGVELEALASALKVNPQKIHALEADNLAILPGTVFARGLASNICRYLGLDAQPVLSRMATDKPRIVMDDEALNMPFKPGQIPGTIGVRAVPVWAIAAIAALLLGALALFLLPGLGAKWSDRLTQNGRGSFDANALPAPPASSASAAVQPSTLALSTAAAPTAQTPVQVGAVTPDASPPSGAASAAVPVQVIDAGPSGVMQPTASAPILAAADHDKALVFKAGADSDVWVQVRNAAGKKLFERSIAAGAEEKLVVSQYPVRVTVGRAESMQVIDRGQPFDLSAVAKTGVARFELK